MIRLFHLWLGWLLLISGLHAEPALPASPEPHYLRDDAGWLSRGAFEALDARLEAFERESSTQIVVGIFPGLPDGAELFDYSQRIFESWKPGQKGKDNGAILLVFAADRKMRIHVGRGLEGALPDARCKQILQDIIAPRLRSGDRDKAVVAGVDAMIAAAKGEYQGNGKTQLDSRSKGSKGLPWPLVIIGIIVILKLLELGKRVKYYSAGGWSYSPGSGWDPTDQGGSWSGGGFSGGGFSGGGGDSGGGFSGGGGDSGGGGASGSW